MAKPSRSKEGKDMMGMLMVMVMVMVMEDEDGELCGELS